jgi:hypothetical protein
VCCSLRNDISKLAVISPVIKRKRTNNILSENETQETSSLSNAELQRLVMLEQLKTLKTQRRFYQIEIENLDPVQSLKINYFC